MNNTLLRIKGEAPMICKLQSIIRTDDLDHFVILSLGHVNKGFNGGERIRFEL